MNQVATVARAVLNAVLAAVRGVVRFLLGRIDNGRIRRGVGPMDQRQRRTATWLIGFGVGVIGLVVLVGMSSTPKPVVATPVARPYVAATRTPTATPTPTPTPTPAPVVTTEPAPPASDTYVDVDAPHVNLPDGALTGGYCRHKWWC